MPYGKILVDKIESSEGTVIEAGKISSDLDSVARSLDVAGSDVIYDTDTVTPIPAYIYSASQQKTYIAPSIARGENIGSVIGDELTTTEPETYKLILSSDTFKGISSAYSYGSSVNGVTSDTDTIEAAALENDEIYVNGVLKHNSIIDLPTNKLVNFKLNKGRFDGFDVNGKAKFTGTYLEENTNRVVDLDYPLGAPSVNSESNLKMVYRNSTGAYFIASKVFNKKHGTVQKLAEGIGSGDSSDYALMRCQQVYKTNLCFTYNDQNQTYSGTTTTADITPSVLGDSGGVLINATQQYTTATDGITLDLSGQEWKPSTKIMMRRTAASPVISITSGSFTKTYDLSVGTGNYTIIEVPQSDSIVITRTTSGTALVVYGYDVQFFGDNESPVSAPNMYMTRQSSADAYVNNAGASEYAIRDNSDGLFKGSFHGYETDVVPVVTTIDGEDVVLSNDSGMGFESLEFNQTTLIAGSLTVQSKHTFYFDSQVVKRFTFTGSLESNRCYFGMSLPVQRFNKVTHPANFDVETLPNSDPEQNYILGNCNGSTLTDSLTGDSVVCAFPAYSYGSKVGQTFIKTIPVSSTGYNKTYNCRLYDVIDNIGGESFNMTIQYL